MKLVIQIPCLNEASTIEAVLHDIPLTIPGIKCIETIVIDDGSTDGTSDAARRAGANVILRLRKRRGLAAAFSAGIEAAINRGADIIVNLDGDHQYSGQAIPALIAPIIAGEADIVIGNRQPEYDRRNVLVKRLLYRWGCFLMNRLCSVHVPDPVSGFRALSRAAAMEIYISSIFSYTLEMIIQAEHKRLAIAHVTIIANAATRPSRLFKNIPQFIYFSSRTIIETYLLYKPFKFFLVVSSGFLFSGLIPILRFLLEYFHYGRAGHIQSLLLGSGLILIAMLLLVAGLLSHLIAHNRNLLERLVRQGMQRDRPNAIVQYINDTNDLSGMPDQCH